MLSKFLYKSTRALLISLADSVDPNVSHNRTRSRGLTIKVSEVGLLVVALRPNDCKRPSRPRINPVGGFCSAKIQRLIGIDFRTLALDTVIRSRDSRGRPSRGPIFGCPGEDEHNLVCYLPIDLKLARG